MIRRLLILSFFALLATQVAIAEPIPYEEALHKAQRLLARNIWSVGVTPIKPRRIIKEHTMEEKPAYYIFNADGGNGFVILAGDDLFPELIGYSDHGTIDQDGEMPEALEYYLNLYTQFVQKVRSGKTQAPKFVHRANGESMGTPVVGPLLTAQWGQGNPYNLLCPEAGKKRAPVGCVATAMSQILYYWKWPNKGKGYMSYSTQYGTLSSDFSSHTYDWSILTDKVTSNSTDEAQAMVSQICYDCGVATKMDYQSSGSGSHTDLVLTALYTYFSYRPSTLRYYYRECMNNEDEWENIIKRELNDGRPIQMSAASSSAGHSFVLDGYDSNSYIHVNWGWDGKNDGYYHMSLMNPGSDRFVERQAILVGIEPNRDNAEERRMQVPVYLEDSLTTTWKQRKVNQFFSVSIGKIYNNRSEGHGFTLGIGLYDARGNFIADVSQDSESKTIYWAGFYGNPKFGTLSCKLTEEVISQCTDGNYVLRLLSKEQGYDEWMWPDVVGGSNNNKIPVYIHDGLLDFNQYAPSPAEDVNNDLVVDSQDVLQVYTAIKNGVKDGREDVNKDGIIDSQDVLTIYAYIVSH